MDFKIVWTAPATEQLRLICEYISNDNLPASERFGEEIFRHVETLGSFPFIGPPYPRGSEGKRRMIVYGNYLIFYRVKEVVKEVHILSVWHGARGKLPFEAV